MIQTNDKRPALSAALKELHENHSSFTVEILDFPGTVRVVPSDEIENAVMNLHDTEEMHIRIPAGAKLEYGENKYAGPCVVVYRLYSS